MRRSLGWWLAALAAVLNIAGTATPAQDQRRPNFVVILADDMRPDCIAALGHPVVRTPHLDALAREGTTLTRAVAAFPVCVVSRAELLTGTTAFRNGVTYGRTAIDPTLRTWAGTLRDAGYRTWFCGKWHNDGEPRTRGYDETRGLFSAGGGGGALQVPDHAGRVPTGYVDWTFKTDAGLVQRERGVGLTPDTDRYVGDAAVELIRQGSDRPFFLHVNFPAPHDPRIRPRGFERSYEPGVLPLPPSFQDRHPFDHGNAGGRDELLLPRPLDPRELREELAVYYACISALDAQVGRIIAALRDTGELRRTYVVFSSDQGLALGSHGLLGKQNLYEHTFRVPFLVKGPGIPAGRKLNADAYLRDLFPTTCELAGVPVPATVQSRSLAGLMRGGAATVHPFVVGYYTDTQRCIREGKWKLIRYSKADRTQLFDLRKDPLELSDLSANPSQARRVKRLTARMEAWLREHGDPLYRVSQPASSGSRAIARGASAGRPGPKETPTARMMQEPPH
jgi:arylsulfatase A-like enzyme